MLRRSGPPGLSRVLPYKHNSRLSVRNAPVTLWDDLEVVKVLLFMHLPASEGSARRLIDTTAPCSAKPQVRKSRLVVYVNCLKYATDTNAGWCCTQLAFCPRARRLCQLTGRWGIAQTGRSVNSGVPALSMLLFMHRPIAEPGGITLYLASGWSCAMDHKMAIAVDGGSYLMRARKHRGDKTPESCADELAVLHCHREERGSASLSHLPLRPRPT